MANGDRLPEQSSFSFHQWLTCEAYLGSCLQHPIGNGIAHVYPSTDEQLARAVATLHRRTEEATYMGQEVYVSVIPNGLQLSMNPAIHDGRGYYNPTQRITKTFLTNHIARCSSNRQPCQRIFIWVCETESAPDFTRNMEIHGILCKTKLDAIRLAHTLSNAFQCMFQSRVLQRNHIVRPQIHGNSLPPLQHRPIVEVPLTDIGMLPSFFASASATRGDTSVKGNEMSCTFAGDMTVAFSSPPGYQSRPGSAMSPLDYQSRPESAMSISARRVSSPTMSDNGMTYLD